MATREETVKVNVEGNAEKKYKDVAKAIDKVKSALDKSKGASAGLAAAAIKLKVGMMALQASVVKAVEQFAENEAAAGRLQRVYERSGASAQELARANKIVERSQTEYGISVQDSSDALRRLMQATGDAQKAESDYKLAVSLAAAENISLTEATKLVSDARDGNVRGLARLSGVTKDFATDLQSVEDETKRGDLAIQQLTESYDGAAAELRGTADDIAVFKQAISDIFAAVGELIVEFGTLTRRGLEIATFSSEGTLSITNIAHAFKGFTASIKETFKELEVFASIDWSTALSEGMFAAYDKLQNERARARARIAKEEKAAAEEEAPAFVGPTIDVKELVAREKEAQEAAKREEAAEKQREAKRKASRQRAQAEAERMRQQEAAAAQRAIEEAEKARVEAEERAWRDEKARLIMRGEERMVIAKEMLRNDPTAGEIELQLARWKAEDEQREKEAADREKEIADREHLATLRLQGQEVEAQLFEIRQRNLTPLEEELAIKQVLAAQTAELSKLDEERTQTTIDTINAASGLATGIMKELGLEEEAKRAAAGLDALVYGYKAGAAFAAFNFPQGLAFTTAAVSAAAVAAGSGSGGGGGARPSPGAGASAARAGQSSALAAAQREERTATMSSGRQAREQNIVINFRSVARPTPEDARQIGQAVAREQATQIGRGGR